MFGVRFGVIEGVLTFESLAGSSVESNGKLEFEFGADFNFDLDLLLIIPDPLTRLVSCREVDPPKESKNTKWIRYSHYKLSQSKIK